MAKARQKSHPYHYSAKKNSLQKFFDWAGPVGLFILYFVFYNKGVLTASEMIKTTGLLGISLLALTLAIGPLSRFISFVNLLKAHRTFWGIASFVIIAIHLVLIFVYYLQFDFLSFFNPNIPHYAGIIVGVLAFLILLLISLTSHPKIMKSLDPRIWKAIQTLSYFALIFALAHFYLMEEQNGVLVIRRFAGRATFWFAFAVIIFRSVVFLLPRPKSRK